ncbi:MAG: hypothetical protein IAG10_01600 [Planctomycetaceae bacterium]|nr:hypothetical protein [Planctomycetaceae bacterium]
MRRLFLGNFHFESELAAARGWNPAASLLRMAAERAPSWIALAEEGDLIWTPEPIADSFWESLTAQGLPRVRSMSEPPEEEFELVPWGWSLRSRMLGGRTAQPSDEAVRLGNSREWSFELEQQLGVALPGTAQIERIEEIADIVRRSASQFGESESEHAWVIKANFGMAARERILSRGSTLTTANERWLQRRLQSDGVVFFEPWLRRRAEVGIQWTLPKSGHGQPELRGITPLLTDKQGGYRGSEFSLDVIVPTEWQCAVDVSQQAALRLQQLGYFGPLGIDAAIYDDSAGRALARPLQDINARYTMGRLALGFRRLLRPGEQGVWLHGQRDEWSGDVTREIDLAPPLIGDSPPTHRSRVLIQS